MIEYKPIIQNIEYNGYRIGILRLDLIHPEISGNKWFKLKYNINEAKIQQANCVVTFGGAFSNHIAATAVACKMANIKCIGIIRGEEKSLTNPTLQLAKQNQMNLEFVTRADYKLKNENHYLEALKAIYPNSYIIPEGGNNALGIKGCQEILTTENKKYSTVFCAHGTGATYKGLAKSISPTQKLMVVNVLNFEATTTENQTTILNNYHFGGYAKHTPELLEFKKWFENTYFIPLDYVYTGKLFFAAFDLMKQKKINSNQKILIIHCGGLQGNKGYEERYNLNPSRHVNDAQG